MREFVERDRKKCDEILRDPAEQRVEKERKEEEGVDLDLQKENSTALTHSVG